VLPTNFLSLFAQKLVVLCIIYILYNIAASVRRNRLLARATRAEIENIVKLWLRYAGDRDGGRQARNRRHSAGNDTDQDCDSE
jgi:hypothetical protein